MCLSVLVSCGFDKHVYFLVLRVSFALLLLVQYLPCNGSYEPEYSSLTQLFGTEDMGLELRLHS